MKLNVFFASAALSLTVSVPAFSCGPYWNLPKDYRMFRTYDKDAKSTSDQEENCLAWQTLCSPDVRTSDISEVVYSYDLDQIRGLLRDRKSSNSFVKHIASARDREIADFLVLAKTCETARAEMNDPWYYPSKEDPVKATLQEVIEKSTSYKGERLEDRYVLQAVRAMFSLGRYTQIDSLWNARKSRIKDGVIKRMTLGYVAGAAYHSGKEDKALEYYKHAGDLRSLYHHFSRFSNYAELVDFAATNCPDSKDIPELLQAVLGGNDSSLMLGICLKGASNAQRPMVWYYSAAYLSDCLGDSARASDILSKAEASKGNPFISESVKVMRIYLDAKNCTYDAGYENKLYGQLRWLDAKIKDNITPNVREITEDGYHLHISCSYYYWNDMMRKILIGHVAPKMDAVNPVLSLRLRNMADNRLLQLVNRVAIEVLSPTDDEGKCEWVRSTCSLSEYRADSEAGNLFDYSNYFFEALDTMSMNAVRRYERIVGTADSSFGKFLDERGYVSRDYLRELIGTRYLRERSYAEAVKYLASVSPSYEKCTNVYWYFDRQPFEYGPVTGTVRKNYKLSFAREMSSLESKMRSSDPDVRGTALVRYGIGLKSSFDDCWALTQYHLMAASQWPHSEYCKEACSDAEEYIRLGLKTIKDPELASQNYASVGLWISAVEKFPQTKSAQTIMAQCDIRLDHQGRAKYLSESLSSSSCMR